MIQASLVEVPSPIEGEAAVLLLAANVPNLIHLQQVTLLTDNLSLARAATSTDIRSDKVLWEIRDTITHFSQIT
jgi:hypothetical protein